LNSYALRGLTYWIACPVFVPEDVPGATFGCVTTTTGEASVFWIKD
jgi:hypothetical protein